MLDEVNYFFPPDRAHVTKRMVRTLLTKPGWSSNEVRTFRGILTEIRKGPR
jgi:tRNA/rRNA methyltransferase